MYKVNRRQMALLYSIHNHNECELERVQKSGIPISRWASEMRNARLLILYGDAKLNKRGVFTKLIDSNPVIFGQPLTSLEQFYRAANTLVEQRLIQDYRSSEYQERYALTALGHNVASELASIQISHWPEILEA